MSNSYAQKFYIALLFLLLPSTASAWWGQDHQASTTKKVLEVIQEQATNESSLTKAAKDFLEGYKVQGSREQAELEGAVAAALRKAKIYNYTLTAQDYRFMANRLLLMRHQEIRLTLYIDYTEDEHNTLLAIREEVLKVIAALATTDKYYNSPSQELLDAYSSGDAVTKLFVDQLLIRALRQAKQENRTLTPRDYEILAHCLLVDSNTQGVSVFVAQDSPYIAANALLLKAYQTRLNPCTHYTQAERNELVRVREHVLAVIKAEAQVGQDYKAIAQAILDAYHSDDVRTKVLIDQLIIQALRQAKKDNPLTTDIAYQTLAYSCFVASTQGAEVMIISCYCPV